MSPDFKFRSLSIEDSSWVTESWNDPEVAKYFMAYPRTEHDVKEEWIRKVVEEALEKTIVAELNGEPAGSVSVEPEKGRCRHVAWLGIFVRRKHWGKGVGSALMAKAIELAKGLGCRKLTLATTEGNERAIRLYKKFGFNIEAYKSEDTYVNGLWKKEYFMSLELAPCEPKFNGAGFPQSDEGSQFTNSNKQDSKVRQLMDADLDELWRLQNCPESTKSSVKIPPITRKETQRWYERIRVKEGRFCYACFKSSQLLGYVQFRTGFLDAPNVYIEEITVDVNRRPLETADILISAVKNFRERYGYRRIFTFIPQTSTIITKTLEKQGFKKTGALRNYYFIDGCYVDAEFYEYP